MSVISPSCPSNANLARYNGTSGRNGGGGGGALIRGGAGGGALSFPIEDDITGGCRTVAADAPGRGWGLGLGLDVCDCFCTILQSKESTKTTNHLQAHQPLKASLA